MADLYLTPPSFRHKQEPTIREDRPAYRIIDERGFFCDDNLWPNGSIVYYSEEPNEQMEPLNELAREAMMVYLTKLDGFAKEVALKDGKRFVSRAKNLEDAMADLRDRAKAPELKQGDGGTPILSGKRKNSAPKAQSVLASEVSETTARSDKRSTIQSA